MRAIFVGVALASVSALAACAPAAPTHDQTYYLVHAAERTNTLAECRSKPAELETNPNCANAAAAAGKVESDRFWTIKKPNSRVANPSSL